MGTAYEAARKVFIEHFREGKHVEKSKTKDSHTGELIMRFAMDIQFLSLLENKARSNGDHHVADEALTQLEDAFDFVYRNVTADGNEYYERTSIFNSPSASLMAQACIYMRYYNFSRLSDHNPDTQQRTEMLKDDLMTEMTDVYINDTYGDYGTFQEIVRAQEYRNASENLPVFSINIISLYGAALAMDSYLMHHAFENDGESVPKDYKRYGGYDRIVEIGDFIKAMDYDHMDGKGRENKIGGGRELSNTVSAGYTSWVAWSEAQIAFGHCYDVSSIEAENNSVYTQEADAVWEGFQTTYERDGVIHENYYDHGGTAVEGNKIGYLYPMVFSCTKEKDKYVKWLDNNVHDFCDAQQEKNNGDEAVVRLARIDVETTTTVNGDPFYDEPFFHRALTGLTMGMIKNISFR
ncbi:hypothetical protein [Salibacterium lacus]|uniref:Uncharacterized protein n=1 Tax=Salibacterium lacus TaxID=1898109 RepID=A0ABW5T5A3_9BACI